MGNALAAGSGPGTVFPQAQAEEQLVLSCFRSLNLYKEFSKLGCFAKAPDGCGSESDAQVSQIVICFPGEIANNSSTRF